MTPSQHFIRWLILLYTGFYASQLLTAWGTRIESFSWIYFLIWIAPVLLQWVKFPNSNNPYFLLIGIVLTFMGNIGSINTLRYLGFGAAIAGTVPWRSCMIPWLLFSVIWIPAVGWFGIYFFPITFVNLIRLSLISIASIWYIYKLLHLEKPNESHL